MSHSGAAEAAAHDRVALFVVMVVVMAVDFTRLLLQP